MKLYIVFMHFELLALLILLLNRVCNFINIMGQLPWRASIPSDFLLDFKYLNLDYFYKSEQSWLVWYLSQCQANLFMVDSLMQFLGAHLIPMCSVRSFSVHWISVLPLDKYHILHITGFRNQVSLRKVKHSGLLNVTYTILY